MTRRSSTPILAIYLIYLLAIAMTTALLVFWVVVVQRFDTEINQLVSRLGVEWNHFHWFVQATGTGLFFLLVVALTYLLAVTLAERRYSRKREELLSNITHELKSPVAAIKLHAQTLEGRGTTPDDRRCIHFILGEADRVAVLVDNLIESSRLVSHKASSALRPIDLQRFFADYQDEVRRRFDIRAIDLRFEVRSRAAVMATTEALQKIMDNLIDNALRFTKEGGRIHCLVRDARDRAEIVVADNGIGVPRRELRRIFDRFYRLGGREVRGRHRGTGLGLAIVRGLVEELRGRIRAISHDGEPGTRFEIQLPRAEKAGALEEGR